MCMFINPSLHGSRAVLVNKQFTRASTCTMYIITPKNLRQIPVFKLSTVNAYVRSIKLRLCNFTPRNFPLTSYFTQFIYPDGSHRFIRRPIWATLKGPPQALRPFYRITLFTRYLCFVHNLNTAFEGSGRLIRAVNDNFIYSPALLFFL